jgi:DNA end-binding protein Ku
VTPEDEEQAKTFSVFREALAETGKAGLGEVAFGGREHLVALMPADGEESRGMMAYTLRYAEELRDGASVFSKIKSGRIDGDQLELAKELIRRNSAKFDPQEYKDEYEAALRELIDAKMQRKPLPLEAPRKTAKVISLTDALRRSLSKKGRQKFSEGWPVYRQEACLLCKAQRIDAGRIRKTPPADDIRACIIGFRERCCGWIIGSPGIR